MPFSLNQLNLTSLPADDTIPNRDQHQKFKDAVEKDFGEMNLENAFAHINKYNPEIHFSQFDMVIIQLDLLAGFIKPDTHGIEDEDEGLQGFVHHWAVVGRLLGIQDPFNLALHPSRDCRILRNVMSCMLSMDLTLSSHLESHLEGISAYFHSPGSAATNLYVFTSQVHRGFKGTHLYKLMSWKDKVAVGVLCGMFKLMTYSHWMKILVRNGGTQLYAITSTKFHKLSREDRLKLPAELIV